MYENGEGVPKNYDQAMKWYRKAAELGNKDAPNNIGTMHMSGIGVARNFVKAHMWFSIAGKSDPAAVSNKNLVQESAEKFGSQCIVVAVDAKKVKENKWEIFTHGGRKSTGIDAMKFIEKMEAMGAGEILLTSMDRDGTKKGYDLDLTKKVSNLVNIPVIASGGVGNLEHLRQGIKIGKASAVLACHLYTSPSPRDQRGERMP